ncbi:hypothetical protein QE152_g6142 [Popillia japonica]|uniref:Uncharacterized protein n=1 Tax=Popillia japonica TaxID=7064 RepID=A0AAW1MK27_POPJA
MGGRPYLNDKKENMEKAIESVKKGISKFRASQNFKVLRTTLIDKIRESRPLKSSRPCVLTADNEQLIAKTLGVVSDWGFPVTQQDIRQVVAKFVRKEGTVRDGRTTNQV